MHDGQVGECPIDRGVHLAAADREVGSEEIGVAQEALHDQVVGAVLGEIDYALGIEPDAASEQLRAPVEDAVVDRGGGFDRHIAAERGQRQALEEGRRVYLADQSEASAAIGNFQRGDAIRFAA